MSLSRRSFLAIPAAAGLAGCAGSRPLRVAVVWSGDELRRFLRVVKDSPYPVTVYSAGDNIGALLRGPSGEVTPDVAVIPRLGLLYDPEIRRRISPLTPIRRQPEFWRDLASPVPGQVLGAWFKIAHKSLVWHRDGEGLARPPTLDAWASRTLSIGAADGWVLTDWFENVLLARSPSTYSKLFSHGESSPELWATGEVRQALEQLATIWQQGVTAERGRRALTLQFHDSILDVFTYRTAEVVAAPDFAWPVIARYHAAGVRAAHFRFPANGGAAPPLVIGGDVAVAMSGGTADAFDFVHWLTSPRPPGGDRSDTQEAWAAEGGFLAPYIDASISPPALRGAARDLAGVRTGQYDLSDRLTGPLAGGDGRGLWRILTELFIAVTIDRAQPATAAGTAADDLVSAGSRGSR
ncbi:hypothetical protein [Nonomuraea glycinis]|uniref:hypothetical protein n=1 Tax=Nonomuraea glycinis TaxID=2047744 RepID=UPI002E0F3E92|nr:hypothetical protein OHA68_37745 [Nonomuraea glycinis]